MNSEIVELEGASAEEITVQVKTRTSEVLRVLSDQLLEDGSPQTLEATADHASKGLKNVGERFLPALPLCTRKSESRVSLQPFELQRPTKPLQSSRS